MDVQLCREMGWTKQQLEAQDDDFVWDCQTVLGLESAKLKRDTGNNRPPQRRPL